MAELHTGFEGTGDIDLFTNTKKLIASSVGIGIAIPVAKLDVLATQLGFGMQISNIGAIGRDGLKVIGGWTSDDDVALFTGNDGVATQTVVIKQTGKVGIGTTTPSVKLDVIGDTKIGTKDLFVDTSGHAVGIGTITPDTENISGAEYCIDIHADTSGALSMFSTSRNGADGAFIGAFIGVADDQDANYRDVASFNFLMDGTTDGKRGGMIKFYTQADNSSTRTAKMTIKQTGYVGIGTETPASLLHVKTGTSGATPQAGTTIALESSTITNYMSFISPNTGYSGFIFGDPQDSDVGYVLYYHGDDSMQFRTNASVNMTLDSSGYLGIGTGSPDSKLQVVGDSRVGQDASNQVRVSTAGLQTYVGSSAGIPSGSCYGNHIAFAVNAGGATVANTWYNISDASMNTTTLLNVTHDGNGKLTCPTAGRYFISYTLCYDNDSVNDHIETGIEQNGSGSALANGQGHTETKFANKEHHLSGSTISDLSANDTLEVAIRSTDGGSIINVQNVNLTCFMIAGPE